MWISRFYKGVWLIAMPLIFLSAHAAEDQPELMRFTLEENTARVAAMLGAPAQVGEAGPHHFSWYLQINVADNHDHSHVLLFRKTDQKLVSVTRDYDEPENVDRMFPAGESRTYYWQAGTQPRWPVRVRKLDGNRVLIAMGVAGPGQRTNQVLLIRRSAVADYLPWLQEQLTGH